MAIHIGRGIESEQIQKILNIPEDIKIKDYKLIIASREVTTVEVTVMLSPDQVKELTKLISDKL